MDHSSTQRRLYDLFNAGDIDGFGGLLATTSSSPRKLPALAPARDGAWSSFACTAGRSRI